MLTSDFLHEQAVLIRSLEAKVRAEPALSKPQNMDTALDHIERGIVALVALHVSLRGVHAEG